MNSKKRTNISYKKELFLSIFIYYCNLFVTYSSVRTSNINRERSYLKSEYDKRNKARPGKMYKIRRNIKNTRESVTFLRRNALHK